MRPLCLVALGSNSDAATCDDSRLVYYVITYMEAGKRKNSETIWRRGSWEIRVEIIKVKSGSRRSDYVLREDASWS
ncbi:hypothetical protein L6452_44366 [Arctium lappa]|uniref:Uncharacterized protein n=1 Tax=Arctium lappa TaxID=4217 RepID=A0ACB8XFP6_ARCLA|nr:hypothetical protein L6452_44366 [Arctium lappa]